MKSGELVTVKADDLFELCRAFKTIDGLRYAAVILSDKDYMTFKALQKMRNIQDAQEDNPVLQLYYAQSKHAKKAQSTADKAIRPTDIEQEILAEVGWDWCTKDNCPSYLAWTMPKDNEILAYYFASDSDRDMGITTCSLTFCPGDLDFAVDMAWFPEQARWYDHKLMLEVDINNVSGIIDMITCYQVLNALHEACERRQTA